MNRSQTLFLIVFLGLANVGCAGIFRMTPPGPRVTGLVEEPTSDLLRIMTTDKESREIRIDAKTHYTKWLLHQPWKVDKYVDAKSLVLGRCVNVVLRTDDVRVAQLVRVSLERTGGLYDPCKAIR